MTKITYQVTLSSAGAHSVSVTGDDPTEVNEALAWAKGLYLKLKTLPSSKYAEQAQPEGDPPLCPVHQVPMVWQHGRKGAFWSCHQKDADGSWCSFKP